MDAAARRRVACIFEVAVRLALGGVFAWAAWSKLDDPALFASQVAAYRILPQPLVELVALVLPPLELLSGIMLVATKWSREAAFAMLAMLAVFTIALAQAAVRGLDIACGCFADEAADRGAMALAVAMVRDLLMMVPLAWLLCRRSGKPGRGTRPACPKND